MQQYKKGFLDQRPGSAWCCCSGPGTWCSCRCPLNRPCCTALVGDGPFLFFRIFIVSHVKKRKQERERFNRRKENDAPQKNPNEVYNCF